MAPEILTSPARPESIALAISDEINKAQVIASAVATNLNSPAGEDIFIIVSTPGFYVASPNAQFGYL
jgi:hypothetical protein